MSCAAFADRSGEFSSKVHALIYKILRGSPLKLSPPLTRASPGSAGTLLSTVMLLAIIVTTTWLRTGVAHDIVRPLSNVAEIPASPARSGVELLAGQVRG